MKERTNEVKENIIKPANDNSIEIKGLSHDCFLLLFTSFISSCISPSPSFFRSLFVSLLHTFFILSFLLLPFLPPISSSFSSFSLFPSLSPPRDFLQCDDCSLGGDKARVTERGVGGDKGSGKA